MFVWRYLDAEGAVTGNSDPFKDRASAEAWLSAEWEPLSDSGVAEVVLFDEDDGDAVYRMSLAPGES